MIMQETICKCDICGKEMRESSTGHKHWPCYLVLGSNLNEADTERYDDVCAECATVIRIAIDRRQAKSKNQKNEGDAFSEFGSKR